MIWRLFLFAFVAGALAALSMPGWGYIPLISIGFSTFYLLLIRAQTRGQAFALGWLFGFGYFVVGLHWVANALLIDDNPYRWAYPLALMGLPALLSFFWGFAALGTNYLAQKKPALRFPVFVLCFFVAELARGYLFTGFPWNLPGYVWANVLPMVQSVAWIGVYGLTVLTLFWATLPGYIFTLIQSPQKRYRESVALLISALIIFGVLIFAGTHRLKQNPTQFQNIDLVLVQPNIPQKDKWNPQFYVDHFQKHLDLSAPNGTKQNHTVIVWPETAIPAPLFDHPETFRRISSLLKRYPSGATLMTGVLREDSASSRPRYFNSFATITADQSVPVIYDKSHLVPFGEYMPFQNYIPLRPIAEFPSFEGGAGPTTFTAPHVPPFTPLICYEIIFPGNVTPPAAQLQPEWLVNITNDSWYGDTAGPHQHLAHAVFRAVEEGTPVVRVAMTGISVVIDPLGRITARADLNTEKTVRTQLPLPLIH